MRFSHSLHLSIAGAATRALTVFTLIAACPGVARSEFWSEKDWKDHDHKLTVCVNTAHCPPGFVDSVKAAVDLWNAKKLTWVFTFQGTDCSNADITVGCKNLPFDHLGEATSRYVAGTNNVVNHVDILIKSNINWAWCNEAFEIVTIISHELGHAMRLKDLPRAKQRRVMRGEQLSAGHDRGPSPEDSSEAEASDTATVITTTTVPKAKEKQTGGGGTIVPAPGTWPFDFQRATSIILRAFNPFHFQIANYQPTGPNSLAWQGFLSTPEASMELYHLVIAYPESVSVREGLLYVTDVAFPPGWAPDAVAPPDTMVATDADDIILYPARSSHPGGDVNAYRWIVDGKMEVEGMGGLASVNLPAGLHQIILVAEDQAGTQDRDTMQVNVLANADVPPRPVGEVPRLSFPVPFFSLGMASLPIRFELRVAGAVSLTLYDMQGRLIRTLRQGELESSGPHVVPWDLRDADGIRAPTGSYVCALRTGGMTVVRKLVVVR